MVSLAYMVAPANVHVPRLYEPTLKAFEVPTFNITSRSSPQMQSTMSREIRQYNQKV